MSQLGFTQPAWAGFFAHHFFLGDEGEPGLAAIIHYPETLTGAVCENGHVSPRAPHRGPGKRWMARQKGSRLRGAQGSAQIEFGKHVAQPLGAGARSCAQIDLRTRVSPRAHLRQHRRQRIVWRSAAIVG